MKVKRIIEEDVIVNSCPFCGSSDLRTVNGLLSVAVSCNKCNAVGPQIPQQEDMNVCTVAALTKWNMRSL